MECMDSVELAEFTSPIPSAELSDRLLTLDRCDGIAAALGGA
jgi:hypothetical protein